MHFEDGYPSLEALYSPYLVKRLGPPRQKSGSIERRHQNIATTLQERLEEVVFAQLNQLHKRYKFNQLCMAGGVAFNCVVNGKIFEHTPFEKVYIQPAAGDAGLAIGAAYYLWHQLLNKPRDFVMEHAYWGPAYNELDVSYELGVESRELNRQRCRVTRIGDKDELCQKIAQEIAAGKVVGWFQGRMEWGPRALGNRSILADPRRREMQDMLNAKIKYRESFRPFAPAILEEDTVDYFEDARPSNFMLFAYKVKEAKKQLIPAVVHIDGTARIQTVSKKTNPLFWKLIIEFKKITGIPLILNTSFNENEPIICKPQEAIDCFLRTQIDVLVVGDYILRKYA
jgi:carbamoyltransferase